MNMQRYALDPLFILRLGPALVMILFGIDQFRNPQNWMRYMPAWVPQVTGISAWTIMRLHSIVNILLGALLLSGWKILGVTWASLLWFLSILPFAFMSDWTVGLRDTAMSLSLFALTRLLR